VAELLAQRNIVEFVESPKKTSRRASRKSRDA
jgi:hypothetical protein